ncbi:hypothetical protein [Pelosinus fermentans]|uniref:hypothetical protein n=1 Tax=Pelosinus fermentans TaxID=365349 RepID=UPI00130DC9A4|nr:hypothetical protein [Pelosinus fermentans]
MTQQSLREILQLWQMDYYKSQTIQRFIVGMVIAIARGNSGNIAKIRNNQNDGNIAQ